MINSVVAYTTYAWEHAIATLRIVSPIEQAGLKLIHGNEGDEIHPERVSSGDAVLIQREFPDYAQQYQEIITNARSEGKPVIYEIDDLLLELPDEHPDQAIDYYTSALFQILRAVLEADIVTTTTQELCDYYKQLNSNTFVLQNYLDDRTWKPRNLSVQTEKESIIIGYMGSSTHTPDLELITPVLNRLLTRYQERIRLQFWGAEPPSTIKEHLRVSWTPLLIKNYAEFAAYFTEQECDIFIAPLVDSFFNRCKSAVKYFEYSILGIPGVYSRIAPYQRVITDGENGLLASNSEEWEMHLRSLIDEPGRRFEIGAKAQNNVLENWCISQHAHQWITIYQQAFDVATDEDGKQQKNQLVQTHIRAAAQVREWQDQLVAVSRQKDRQIKYLEAELAAIKNSRSWKLLQFLRYSKSRHTQSESKEEPDNLDKDAPTS
ncbi:MAG: glycosyltransferase [Chloroflexota bacterium]|nr:glycosyltransferase [Chloroflexota bacterium]